MQYPEFEASISSVLLGLKPIVQKLYTHKKIPMNASVEALLPKDIPTISTLIQREFNIESRLTKERFAGLHEDAPLSLRLSSKLIIGTYSPGALIVYPMPQDRHAFLYGIVIEKRYRRTWCSALLKLRSLERLQLNGYTTIRFQAFKNNMDTTSHARKVRAERVIDSRA